MKGERREGILEEWNVAEERLRISSSQERETAVKVRVSQIGRRERRESVRDVGRPEECKGRENAENAKSSFLKLPPTSLRKSGGGCQFCRVCK